MDSKPSKKKPVRLEWQGGIASAADDGFAARVELKSEKKSPQSKDLKEGHSSLSSGAYKGAAKVRREVKGRGGKPVAVLSEFTPGIAHLQLEDLCRKAKESLGCGGTVEGNALILQVDEYPRLEKLFAKFSVKLQKSGGF
jgi:translation initiation factor 1